MRVSSKAASGPHGGSWVKTENGFIEVSVFRQADEIARLTEKALHERVPLLGSAIVRVRPMSTPPSDVHPPLANPGEKP